MQTVDRIVEVLEEAGIDHRSGAVPILPQRLVKELSESLAPDAIVCADAGNNRVWMLRCFQTKQAGAYWC